MRNSGTDRSMMCSAPSSTPLMVPPFAMSMTGYVVVRNTSPAAITSEPRKYTIVSPSVDAAGWCSRDDPFAVEEVAQLHRVGEIRVGRQRAGRDGVLARPADSPSGSAAFSCARIAAPWPTSLSCPATLPPVNVCPAPQTFTLPPM